MEREEEWKGREGGRKEGETRSIADKRNEFALDASTFLC